MSGQQTSRLDWVDTAKGISIILVVMMYSVFNVGQDAEGIGLFHYVIGFATPFRMPEFFLISGLFLDQVLARTTNKVAVSGHLATGDVSFAGPDPWALSADRAQLTRRLLVASGVGDARLDRVVGKADRGPVVEDRPRDPRNRRVEITLLRKF